MKTYTVKLYFHGTIKPDPGHSPTHIFEVEDTLDATYKSVVSKALHLLDGYPRSYYAICDDFEKKKEEQ